MPKNTIYEVVQVTVILFEAGLGSARTDGMGCRVINALAGRDGHRFISHTNRQLTDEGKLPQT